jgi:hypothetical protein
MYCGQGADMKMSATSPAGAERRLLRTLKTGKTSLARQMAAAEIPSRGGRENVTRDLVAAGGVGFRNVESGVRKIDLQPGQARYCWCRLPGERLVNGKRSREGGGRQKELTAVYGDLPFS